MRGCMLARRWVGTHVWRGVRVLASVHVCACVQLFGDELSPAFLPPSPFFCRLKGGAQPRLCETRIVPLGSLWKEAVSSVRSPVRVVAHTLKRCSLSAGQPAARSHGAKGGHEGSAGMPSCKDPQQRHCQHLGENLTGFSGSS